MAARKMTRQETERFLDYVEQMNEIKTVPINYKYSDAFVIPETETDFQMTNAGHRMLISAKGSDSRTCMPSLYLGMGQNGKAIFIHQEKTHPHSPDAVAAYISEVQNQQYDRSLGVILSPTTHLSFILPSQKGIHDDLVQRLKHASLWRDE